MALRTILQRIDELRTALDALRPIDPDRMGKVMQKLRLDWNFHSNHIEGNSLTFGETKSFLLHGITADGKPLKDHLDIKGHNEALLWLDDVIKENRPLTEKFIRELHELILKEPYRRKAISAEGVETTREIKIGQYKTTPNHVKTATGEMFYFASPEETPAKMQELIDWYRAESESEELHPLLLAGLLHYKFILIHPFDDGNGRVSRILMNLVLMAKGYPPLIVESDKDKRGAYYTALQKADGGDEDAILAFLGERLVRSLDIMIRGAKGENIEEEDDLTKRIKLLKAELKTDEEFEPEEKSEIGIRELLVNSIEPVLQTLKVNLIESFDELFLLGSVNLFFPDNYMDFGPTVAMLRKQLNSIISTGVRLEGPYSFKNLSGSVFDGSFKNFKKTGKEFDLKILIYFSFKTFGYSASLTIDEKKEELLSSRTYAQPLTETEQKNLIRTVLERCVEEIENKLRA